MHLYIFQLTFLMGHVDDLEFPLFILPHFPYKDMSASTLALKLLEGHKILIQQLSAFHHLIHISLEVK